MAGHRDSLQTQLAREMVRVPLHAYGTTVLINLEGKCELKFDILGQFALECARWERTWTDRAPNPLGGGSRDLRWDFAAAAGWLVPPTCSSLLLEGCDGPKFTVPALDMDRSVAG